MTWSQIQKKSFFTFHPLPSFRDVVFLLFIFCAALVPVMLMTTYFQVFTIGFQLTLLVYLIVLCGTVLIAFGIARIFLLINTYRQREKIYLESIGDGICGIDGAGRIILWNTAAETISGFSKKEIRHMSLTRVLESSTHQKKIKKDQFIRDILTARHTLHISSSLVLKTKGGHSLPLNVTASPITDQYGTLQGAIIVFWDMTREQEIDRAKNEFVSLVSHELRTPLTNMNWRLEMFHDGEAGKLTEKQKKYLGEIEDCASRMTDLVNLFLNISRIRMGTLGISLRTHNIHTLISTAIEEYAQRITQKNLTLKRKIPKTIGVFVCDQRIFQVIIQNIIVNAIEYTPAGGTIMIQAKKEDARLIISVADSGIGIPKKEQSKIFSKLFRAENVKMTFPNGNGLGLYLVKLLLDESGGDIWFTSKEGEGTTFFISFPITGMRKKRGTRSLIVTQHP